MPTMSKAKPALGSPCLRLSLRSMFLVAAYRRPQDNGGTAIEGAFNPGRTTRAASKFACHRKPETDATPDRLDCEQSLKRDREDRRQIRHESNQAGHSRLQAAHSVQTTAVIILRR